MSQLSSVKKLAGIGTDGGCIRKHRIKGLVEEFTLGVLNVVFVSLVGAICQCPEGYYLSCDR